MLPIILALMTQEEHLTSDEAEKLLDKLNSLPQPYNYKEADKLVAKLLKEIRDKSL